MATQQPLVIRSHFRTELEAQEAHSQLESIGVFGDTYTSKEHKSFTVLFTESTSLNLARNSLKRIQTRPFLVEAFFPENDWNDGFKTVNISY